MLKNRFSLPIRVHLFILVLVAILPALAIIVFTGMERRHAAIEDAKIDIRRLTQGVAIQQQQITNSTLQLLMTLARVPAVQKRDAKSCNRFFHELVKQNPSYAAINIATPRGTVFASAPAAPPFDISDRKYFKDVLNSGDFAVGEFIFSVAAQRPVFHYAYPVSDGDQLQAVIVAAFDASYYSKLFSTAKLPPGSALALTDGSGIRLYRYPDFEKYAGTRDLPEMIARMSAGEDEGTFFAAGVDGKQRLYGFKRLSLPGKTVPYLFIRVGIPEETALSQANQAMIRNLQFLSLAALMAMILAYILGNSIIVRRLNVLVTTSHQLAHGNLAARTGLPHGGNEFGQLANSFDEMAAILEDKESQRREAEKALSQERDRAQQYLAIAGIMFVALDIGGIVRLINKKTCDVLECGEEDITGKNWFECFIPGKDREQVKRVFEKLMKGEIWATEYVENSVVTRNGEEKTIAWHNALLTDDCGNIVGSLSSGEDITERKISEAALRESEERLRTILEAVQAGIVIIDPRTHVITDVNQVAANMIGAPKEKIVGMLCHKFICPAELGKCPVTDLKQTIDHSERILLMQGAEQCSIIKTAVPVTLGGREHLLESFIDITDRKRAEELLLNEVVRATLLLGLYENASKMTDMEMYNYALDQAVQLTNSTIGFLHFVSEDSKSVILTIWNSETLKTCSAQYNDHSPIENAGNWADCVRLKKPVIYNNFQHSPNKKGLPEGHSPINRFMAVPVVEANQVRMIIGVGNKTNDYHDHDVSQVQLTANELHKIIKQRLSEQALFESRELYETLAEKSFAGVYVIQDGFFKYINSQAASLADCKPEELVGIRGDSIVHSEDLEAVKQNARMMLAGQRNIPYEYRVMSKSGTVRWIMETVTNIQYDGKPAILGNTMDITEHKEAEAERKTLEAQLFQAQKMEAIGALAGGISHDFNNILGAIIGYSELCMDQVRDRPKVHHGIEQILKAGHRAKDLVKQILMFSRHSEPEKKPIDIRIVIKEALKLLRSTLPSTIEMHQEIDQDPCKVAADPTQMHQIIMNLCTNAAHAMGERGGILKVTLSWVNTEDKTLPFDLSINPGSYIKLTVSDTGRGIDPAIKDRIFEPFFTTKGIGEGTGLGLSVVYGIVKDHGGTIQVHSAPKEGTTFNIYFPSLNGEDMKHEIIKNEVIPGGRERILLVDDDVALCELGKLMIESLGYAITTRTSCTEALGTFIEGPDDFDLVLTDMTMPFMTGSEFARKIITIRPNVPIVMCTGFSEFIDEERAGLIGIRAFVMKPFSKMDIAKVIRNVLDHR
jgi:two-component system, cell cycle sensor histidine kinase and response regulator CckA